MRKYILLLLLPICFVSCNKTDQSAAADDKIIKQYIADHNLTAVAEPNGLYYVETQAGTGGNPTSTSTVIVTYRGYYTGGNTFNQSTADVSFSLSGVIAGWQQGISLMKKGGRATLLIPSALAYGSQGNYPVPPNTVIIFDVVLKDFH